jgi:hypothetical protein
MLDASALTSGITDHDSNRVPSIKGNRLCARIENRLKVTARLKSGKG